MKIKSAKFRYRNPILDENNLVIIISQSGETADSLAALREAKSRGVTTLGIVNVMGSSIAREADKVFYTLAGPEISVATTKAYSAQLITMYCLAVKFAKVRGLIDDEKYSELISEMTTIPAKIDHILMDRDTVKVLYDIIQILYEGLLVEISAVLFDLAEPGIHYRLS